jgi:serine/threonine protein kinase
MVGTDSSAGVAGCPSRDELVAFSEARLPPETLVCLITHLGECDRCTAALDELVDPRGFATAALRAAGRVDAARTLTAEPEFERMVAEAQHAARAVPPDPPAQLGSYRLGDRIDGGGMGTVYRAFHTRLKRWVALKVIRPDRVDDAKAVARFHREIEAVGRLDHPNVVRATDAGEHAGVHYLVMDLVDGVDLGRLVRRLGRLPVPAACEAARQAAEALQAAHAAGLVHRDVKPSNLLLATDGRVKLLDLGLARLAGQPGRDELRQVGVKLPDLGLARPGEARPAGDELTSRGQIMGTLDYMAPEQWEAGHAVDIRADLYSLGCTIFTLLVGRPPFWGPEYDTWARKMAAHLNHAPPAVGDLRPDIPPGLAPLITRLLAKDPAARFATPAAVAKALAPFAAGADLRPLARRAMDGPAESPPSASTITAGSQGATEFMRPPLRPRRRWRWAVPATVLVGAVTLGIFLRDGGARRIQRGGDETPAPGPVAGEWFELLQQQPVPLIWPKAREHAEWRYDPDNRNLLLVSPERSVFRLGEAPNEPFDLEVTLAQTPWVGAVGVFVHGVPTGAGGDAHLSADMFWLPRATPADDPATARIELAILRWFPEKNHSYPDLLGSDPIVRPYTPEHTMTVTVDGDGPAVLQWDGCPVSDRLLKPATIDKRPGGPAGTIGVVAEGSTVIVKSARLRIHTQPGVSP